MSSQWPMHSERVGEDMHISTSRGFLRGRAGRNAWNAGLGPRVSLREAAGCAGRSASQTLPVPGSRARERPGSDAGPKVVRAGGEGALWPAAAASSLQRWPRCRPRPPIGGGRPSPARPLSSRVGLIWGRRKIMQGHSNKTKATQGLILSYYSGNRPGFSKSLVGKEAPFWNA